MFFLQRCAEVFSAISPSKVKLIEIFLITYFPNFLGSAMVSAPSWLAFWCLIVLRCLCSFTLVIPSAVVVTYHDWWQPWTTTTWIDWMMNENDNHHDKTIYTTVFACLQSTTTLFVHWSGWLMNKNIDALHLWKPHLFNHNILSFI